MIFAKLQLERDAGPFKACGAGQYVVVVCHGSSQIALTLSSPYPTSFTMVAKVVLTLGLTACLLVGVQAGIIGDRALKLGAAIGASGLGYAVHLAPLGMILGANTIRVGHSQPPVYHKTLVHVHEHGIHGHAHHDHHGDNYGHEWH
ncbi:hypothetical protein BIW11_07108 [Tropilaelaps mercedesae]|uniref:Uncharacterized protein n=1 Tax=Tropilaelaps mercedesae TaxID=418985 RepID=A0A1V9XV88_9ACAR|nr:hypothetical protein BIW11_07108 [Tropilaelaps mercedesae]